MSHLPITLGVAIVLGVLFLGLSIRVIMQRGRTKVSLGAGSAGGFQFGNECDASPLFVAIRAQANFAEYVPFSLILIGLNEEAGAPRAIVLATPASSFGLTAHRPELLPSKWGHPELARARYCNRLRRVRAS